MLTALYKEHAPDKLGKVGALGPCARKHGKDKRQRIYLDESENTSKHDQQRGGRRSSRLLFVAVRVATVRTAAVFGPKALNRL